MIDGVVLTGLRQLADHRGKVTIMLRADSPLFAGFGELYFSTVNQHAVKAWKCHTRMVMNVAVLAGSMRFALYDDRETSPTKGQVQEIILSEDNPQLLTVPALVWNGFQGIGEGLNLLANCADILHDPAEGLRREATDPYFPYHWPSNQ